MNERIAQMSAKELAAYIEGEEKRYKLLRRELKALLRIRQAQEGGAVEETEDEE